MIPALTAQEIEILYKKSRIFDLNEELKAMLQRQKEIKAAKIDNLMLLRLIDLKLTTALEKSRLAELDAQKLVRDLDAYKKERLDYLLDLSRLESCRERLLQASSFSSYESLDPNLSSAAPTTTVGVAAGVAAGARGKSLDKSSAVKAMSRRLDELEEKQRTLLKRHKASLDKKPPLLNLNDLFSKFRKSLAEKKAASTNLAPGSGTIRLFGLFDGWLSSLEAPSWVKQKALLVKLEGSEGITINNRRHESILTPIKIFRLSNKFDLVSGGKSAVSNSFSSKIDPYKLWCKYELLDGICMDAGCTAQHFRDVECKGILPFFNPLKF